MNNKTSTRRERTVLFFHVEDPANTLLPSRAETLQCSSPKKVIQFPASFSRREDQLPVIFHRFSPLSFYRRFCHFLHTVSTFLFVTCNNCTNLELRPAAHSCQLIRLSYFLNNLINGFHTQKETLNGSTFLFSNHFLFLWEDLLFISQGLHLIKEMGLSRHPTPEHGQCNTAMRLP